MLLALDASTKSTGYAIYDDNDKLIECGCITAQSQELIKRIYKVGNELLDVIKKHNITSIIMEEVHPEKDDDPKAIQTHRALMWLQAYINFILYDYNKKISILYIYPSEWRKACGIKTGRYIKREELKMADIAFAKTLIGDRDINDDVADAIGIGYGFLHKDKEQFAW